MNQIKTIFAASILASSVVVAIAPASAVVSTFATFSAPTTAANIRYVNSGNGTGRAQDAVVFSTSTATSATKGSVDVRFSFVQPELAAYVTNVTAAFTLDGTIAKNTPTTLTVIPGFGTFFVQTGFTGTMTFLSKTDIIVDAPNFAYHKYDAGSNLLTVTFSKATFSGKIGDSTGSSNESSTLPSVLTFTSDFLDFSPTVLRDGSLALTSTAPVFGVGTGANKALKSFRSNMGGQFSSDPAPLINGLLVVPEPEIWGLMVVGFGLVGLQVRRRKSSSITVY